MFRILRTSILVAACLTALPLAADENETTDPLLGLRADPTTVIDLLLENRWREEGVEPTAAGDDTTFVRRIYLDLAGRIPTLAERDAFLQSTDSRKRSRLIAKLLDSPDFARRMREVFDVALLGRAKDEGELNRRRESRWWRFLESSFADNRPWGEVVEAVLLARSTDDKDRGAAWFLYTRNNKHQLIAEAVSKSLFGIQIQCAQCHDHPLAVEIEQRHYWGLVAFFNRGKNTRTKLGPQLAESAVGGFAKFTDLTGESNEAELVFFQPQGEKLVKESGVTTETKDAPELYAEHKVKELPKEPKFSRRRAFAEQVARDNRLVSRALVNRVWALLMGRGIVHPVDEMDSEHAPSHPRLLQWLERDFHRTGDVKRLVQAIVSSRAYQLEAVGDSRADLFARGLEKPLTAEDLYRSMRVAVTGSSGGEDLSLLLRFQTAFPDVFPVEIVANLKQSLMLSNDPAVVALSEQADDNLTSRLVNVKEDSERLQLACRTILGRDADADEVDAMKTHWSKSKAGAERRAQELVWALLTSPEFRFNH